MLKAGIKAILLNGILIIIIFVSIIFILMYQNGQLSFLKDNRVVSVYLDSTSTQIPLNGSQIVNVMLDTNDKSVSAVDIRLNYNPKTSDFELLQGTIQPFANLYYNAIDGTELVLQAGSIEKSFKGKGILARIIIKPKYTVEKLIKLTLNGSTKAVNTGDLNYNLVSKNSYKEYQYSVK